MTAEDSRSTRVDTRHDRWFRAEVQKALVGLDEGRNATFDEGEWEKIASLKRTDLRRRASGS